MRVQTTALTGVLIVEPQRRGDARGFFSEVFKASALAAHGIAHEWAQDNHVRTEKRGVVRGLHFQAPPHAQAKLVRVTRGAVLDVAVDIRRDSPTYGAHVAEELSAENWRQLYVPAGMAHGYCTLSEDAEVLYKTSAEYAPQAEMGLLWNDPELDIAWPACADPTLLKDADLAWPKLRDLVSPFF